MEAVIVVGSVVLGSVLLAILLTSFNRRAGAVARRRAVVGDLWSGACSIRAANAEAIGLVEVRRHVAEQEWTGSLHLNADSLRWLPFRLSGTFFGASPFTIPLTEAELFKYSLEPSNIGLDEAELEVHLHRDRRITLHVYSAASELPDALARVNRIVEPIDDSGA